MGREKGISVHALLLPNSAYLTREQSKNHFNFWTQSITDILEYSFQSYEVGYNL